MEEQLKEELALAKYNNAGEEVIKYFEHLINESSK